MSKTPPASERCAKCRGFGFTSTADHHPSCDGNCKSACPVQTQYPCDECGGTGRVPAPAPEKDERCGECGEVVPAGDAHQHHDREDPAPEKDRHWTCSRAACERQIAALRARVEEANKEINRRINEDIAEIRAAEARAKRAEEERDAALSDLRRTEAARDEYLRCADAAEQQLRVAREALVKITKTTTTGEGMKLAEIAAAALARIGGNGE